MGVLCQLPLQVRNKPDTSFAWLRVFKSNSKHADSRKTNHTATTPYANVTDLNVYIHSMSLYIREQQLFSGGS